MKLGRLRVSKAARQWVDAVMHDEVFGLAAELAYWFFLSLFPFFIFLAALGGFVASLPIVEDPTGRMVDVLSTYMPGEATRLVTPEIEQVVGTQAPGTLSLGLLFSLWVATSGANAIIRAMNRAYDVHETRPWWRRYLLALGITLVSGMVLTGAFVMFLGGQVFGAQVAGLLGVETAYGRVLDVANWFLVALLLFPGAMFLYRVAPNIHLRLVWLVPGALLFTVGWLLCTYGFALYVARFGAYGATYGALGGVAVLLVWFYLTAFVLLAGAELNAVIDAQIDPEELNAKRREVMDEAREKVRSLDMDHRRLHAGRSARRGSPEADGEGRRVLAPDAPTRAEGGSPPIPSSDGRR